MCIERHRPRHQLATAFSIVLDLLVRRVSASIVEASVARGRSFNSSDSRPSFLWTVSEHDSLIFGAGGLLVAGPNSRHHEPLLCAYLQFITIDIFVQNYFARLWILNDGRRD